MSKKEEESPLSKGIGFLMGAGGLCWLLCDFYKFGIPDELESKTYGGKKVDALFIALTRLGGGEWLPYTFTITLVLVCLYISYTGFLDHFKKTNKEK